MKQLNLFAEQEKTIEQQCLIKSLQGFIKSGKQSNHFTDKQIKTAIAQKWYLGGGANFPTHHCYIGGSNPRLWVGGYNQKNKPTFSGQALINTVRKLLID